MRSLLRSFLVYFFFLDLDSCNFRSREDFFRVGSRKVSLGFLRERDFLQDQPCEMRLLARLESRMVLCSAPPEVVGTRRVLGERHILYLTSYVYVPSKSGLECLARPGLRDETTVSRSRLASHLARSHSKTQL